LEKNRPIFSTTVIRIARNFGVKNCFLVGEAEALGRNVGQFVLIQDHINLTATNPLIGPNAPHWGTRFPDMTSVYTEKLRRALMESLKEDLPDSLHEGILVAKDPADKFSDKERRALEKTGVCYFSQHILSEAIVARHARMDIVGLLRILNPGVDTRVIDSETGSLLDRVLRFIRVQQKKSA